MIFVVSEKVFRKNAKKWLKRRDYIIIDGSDDGSIDMDNARKSELGQTFNNVVINGAFTPHHRLLDALKKDNSSEHLTWRCQNLLDDFMSSAELVAACVAVTKGFTAQEGKEQRNMFVVLPKRVYPLMGTRIVERFYQLMKADFKFVFTEDDLLDSKKLLTKDVKTKDMDYLRERILRVVKKFKLDKD